MMSIAIGVFSTLVCLAIIFLFYCARALAVGFMSLSKQIKLAGEALEALNKEHGELKSKLSMVIQKIAEVEAKNDHRFMQ